MGFGAACSSFCQERGSRKFLGDKTISNEFFEVEILAIHGTEDFEIEMAIIIFKGSESLAILIHRNDKRAPFFCHCLDLKVDA